MKLLAFNHKMNLLNSEIDKYIEEIKKNDLSNCVFCPSAIYIDKFKKNNISVGAQDISFALKGAYTGDLSILQLKEIGITYSIIGHSERRDYYMDNRFINTKIQLCLNNDVIPILCVGETLEENENGKTYNVCINEIDKAFIGNVGLEKIILAYEPIWAIGTDTIPTLDFIENNVSQIKKYVKSNYGIDIKVLYGGGINEDNIQQLSRLDVLDGFLVGSSSLKVDFIKKIIELNK